MARIMLLSDTHLGHHNVLKFETLNGQKLRSEFTDVEQMKERIFDLWNDTVKPEDKVYHLGDVALGSLGRKHLAEMAKLPGKKRLVRGNHDLYDLKWYADVFADVYGVRQINGMWLTHVPMHRDSLEHRLSVKFNVHGHLHEKTVMRPRVMDRRANGGLITVSQSGWEEDPLYYNVSVERIGYQPVDLEWIAEGMRTIQDLRGR